MGVGGLDGGGCTYHACICVQIKQFSHSHTEKTFPDTTVSVRAISGMVARASHLFRIITFIDSIKNLLPQIYTS